MNKTTIIIICSVVFLIVLLFVIIYLIKKNKKSNIMDAVDRLTTEKNLILSASLITELSKASKLSNNKKIEDQIKEWNKRYEELEKTDLPKLTDSIIEIENACFEKEYSEANELIAEVEKDLYHIKAKGNKLLSDIKTLTESEERNRDAITKLKSIYREIVFKYNKNKDEYSTVNNKIELQFENIDKLFSAFEVAINNNEYENIARIVKVLDDMIHNIGVVIEEAPTIILMSTMMLPKKMNDIKSQATKLMRDGFNLEYLNIDYNIEETNKKISDITDRLNVLNLEDSIFDLKTLLDYYEGLYNDFESEKRGKKEYERGIINLTERLNKISSIIRNLYAQIDDLKDTYDLTEEEVLVIDDINKELIDVKDNFKLINDRTLTKVTPYSKLSNECELVAVRVASVEDKLETTLKNLGSLVSDEARARDQLCEIKVILKDAKFKIKEYNLPIIPKKFYVELKEAYDSVKEITKELEKKPISIKTLNLRVDTARDLALKLYQTASLAAKTAAMAEMAIVYGNRYRSTYKEIEEGLINSSKEFYKGEYKNSLEIVLNALNTVEPGIHKKLLSKFEN